MVFVLRSLDDWSGGAGGGPVGGGGMYGGAVEIGGFDADVSPVVVLL